MNTIKAVKLGWKALETILNGMVTGINRRTIIRGAGLSTNETDNGTMIWVTKLGDANGQDATATTAATTTGGPTEGSWVTIDVMDANCNKTQLRVWALPGSSTVV
jgi:hypothetical protein